MNDLKYLWILTLDRIKNRIYRFWAWQWSNRNTQKTTTATPPRNYDVVFSESWEDFNQEPISSNRWRWGHPWGNVHAKQLWRYWPKRLDPVAQLVYKCYEGLALELRNIPRTLRRQDQPEWLQKNLPQEWRPTWATGLISTRAAWKWGWFEAQIKLPTEIGMWSAFWLSGQESWPPEIDIFEAYTQQDPNVIQVCPNLHYKLDGVKLDAGGPVIPVKSPNKRWVQYACHWTPERIQIYYDGNLVWTCSDPMVLAALGKKQYIILNNGCKDPEVTGNTPQGSTMLVRNVKVYQPVEWQE